MSLVEKIIALSEKTAASFLRSEKPSDLEKSTSFSKKDKKVFLTKLTDESKIKERSELIKGINLKEDWSVLADKIKHTTRVWAYWVYAAAASVAVIIAITFFLNKTDTSQTPTQALVNSNIEIGSDKATLTLGDGSNIALEKGTTYQTDYANSNGEELVYLTNGNAKTEIAYNYLTVPRGGQFHVKLSDGTEVWLNSESHLKYPVAFNEGELRQVELIYGEAYFEVSPSTAHKGAVFKVLHRAQEIEVLGTEFNVKAYKGETHIYTTLVEGKVAVGNTVTTQLLLPDQQASLDLKTNDFTIITVDTYNETSWKKGRFWFKAKPLNEIMTVLGRWYDVDVVFAHEELKNVEFTGVLSKNQNIEDILKIFLNTNFINAYDIKDKKITMK